jgi:uncharacterized membrane-anchored protein
MKSISLIVTIVYFVVLLSVPCYTIYNYYDILSTGEAYKIEVGAYDPYDPFRGRYVTIRPNIAGLRGKNDNIQLIKNAEGVVVDVEWNYNTKAPGYVKNLKLERYYMNEKTAPLVEKRQMRAVQDGDIMHVVIKVKNGNYAIDGLYINNIAAEEYVK